MCRLPCSPHDYYPNSFHLCQMVGITQFARQLPGGRPGADLIRLFQRTLFRQANPVTGDDVRFLYTMLSTPPCERRYA